MCYHAQPSGCLSLISTGIRSSEVAGEMGQWFRALSVLPEDLGLILSSQIMVHTWFSKRKL